MLKKFLSSFTLGLALLALSSCSDDIINNEEPGETVESVYYVKYASNGLEGTYNASYAAETGKSISLSSLKGADFERTIGPVSKGFKANVSISSTLQYTTVAVRIEVKKDDGPFVVKKENAHTSSGYACSCGASYTVE